MFSLFKKNMIFHGDCSTNLKNIKENYINVLKRLGYRLLKIEDFNCGGDLIESGYKEEFKNIMEKNKDLLRKNKIDRIITNSSLCYNTFLKYYEIKTEHIVKVLLKNLSKMPYKYNEEKVTYFDPYYLGKRIFGGEKILDALGFVVISLKGNNAISCGASGGVKRNLPVLANKIAKNILKQVKTEKLITSCPLCYIHLKENAKKIKVLELSEVL